MNPDKYFPEDVRPPIPPSPACPFCPPETPPPPPPFIPDIYNPGVPGPTPVHKHMKPPCPPRPQEDLYVRKKTLNEILKNIAEATIFEDDTEDGTTISLGGITKGTDLGSITFTEFMTKLLYPENAEDAAFVTQAELKDTVEDVVNEAVKNASLEVTGDILSE